MTSRDKLVLFAEQLIKQKRITRATTNLLLTSFILLIIGSVAALPLRYFTGMEYGLPLLALISVCILTFVYGFLGLETHLTILQETDEKAGLNQKLSAAFQFGQSENPYSSLIMSDAIGLSDRIKPIEVFPIRFSRRDPFIPLLTGLFLFLWMSSFSFLQISGEQTAMGDSLLDASGRIDAVNSDENDKDLEDLAEEYRKLGQKIQDRFMNQQAIEREVEQLSRKLESKIEELAREGVNKESKSLTDEEADNEIYQLQRKREMGDELGDILESLMKTFSLTPDVRLGGAGESREGSPGDGEGSMTDDRIRDRAPIEDLEEKTDDNGGESTSSEVSELDDGEQGNPGESSDEAESSQGKPGDTDGDNKKNEQNGETDPLSPFYEKEGNGDFDPDLAPGDDQPDNQDFMEPYKEKKQSGEFDDEDNIRGDMQEGEQMKSFIRALPHIVEPTREEMDVIRSYRNQLETAMDKDILPRGYESVIRDYFLAIGVLNDE
ncbi:hypothetical protein [Spirochaeta isovalerica]|uniref:Uncharacterized protein n=1 Tax=Spirochaeta isovalerica TaxID=150 RepID=A0A841R663_9SPIO|nr:hypothetical protein [Spirochaeta isovalerica]MBB6478499.1 hypothetical protein [Spirochaeta isovalerica]